MTFLFCISLFCKQGGAYKCICLGRGSGTHLWVYFHVCVSIYVHFAYVQMSTSSLDGHPELLCMRRAGSSYLGVTEPEDSQFGEPGPRLAAAGLGAALPAWRASRPQSLLPPPGRPPLGPGLPRHPSKLNSGGAGPLPASLLCLCIPVSSSAPVTRVTICSAPLKGTGPGLGYVDEHHQPGG